METESSGSVTGWIAAIKAGDDQSAYQLWERYFDRLVRLTRSKLRASRRGDAEDEEDAALSAFDSFCRGAAGGRFPVLTDRDDLWRLLAKLAVRKAADQRERLTAAKRGGGRVIGEADLITGQPGDSPLGLLVCDEPTPEQFAEVVDRCQRLWNALNDTVARQVLELRLENYSREEIAGQLGCAEKTVTRKLNLIRSIWQTECL